MYPEIMKQTNEYIHMYIYIYIYGQASGVSSPPQGMV